VSPSDELPPLLVIAGATATGKTGLGVRLARALAGEGIEAEIVSADSRQVYRGLDVGTAKATPAERADVPHHGLDLVEPDESFSVADFVRHARTALAGIAARDGLAILVGGTGLYLRAVTRGLDVDALPSDLAVRTTVEAELADAGLEAAAARLQRLAPMLAAETDLRNPRRVARALEIATLVGDRPRPPARGYAAPLAWLGLDADPAAHRRWIVERARAQFEAGLVDEARSLRERFDPTLPAFSAIGYREAWSVLDGERTVDEAIEDDARRNLAFAKRQRTWFRSEPDVEWLAVGDGRAAIDPLAAALQAARALTRPPGAR
jgi:tRNA dimethylallyltransferase